MSTTKHFSHTFNKISLSHSPVLFIALTALAGLIAGCDECSGDASCRSTSQGQQVAQTTAECGADCIQQAVEQALTGRALGPTETGQLVDQPLAVTKLFSANPDLRPRLEAALRAPAPPRIRAAQLELVDALSTADRLSVAETLVAGESVAGRISGVRILSTEAKRNEQAADTLSTLLNAEDDARILTVVLEASTEAVFTEAARPTILAAMRSLIQAGSDEHVRGRALVAAAVHAEDPQGLRSDIADGLAAPSAVQRRFALQALHAVLQRQVAAGDDGWNTDSAIMIKVANIMNDQRAPRPLQEEARDLLERYWL